MRRTTTGVLALSALAALVGCREPGGGDGDADSDADGDAGSDADADADGDGDEDSDGDGETLTCPGSAACVAACGADDPCAVDCARRVCAGGYDALEALVLCGGNQCGEPCADRASAGCGACLRESCAVQVYSCATTSCVEGELSCAEATVCVAGCGTDRTCAEGCSARICPRGAGALSALEACVAASCESECADSGARACGECTWNRCRTESDACLAAACT